MIMHYIIKRDGRKDNFNRRKIERAVEKAFIEVDGVVDSYASAKIHSIADFIEQKIKAGDKEYTVEEIQDLVQNGLMNTKRKDVAVAFITYRNERNRIRGNHIDKAIDEIVNGKSEYWNGENSNKNSLLVTTQRDYIAGEVSTDKAMRELLPMEVVLAHKASEAHFHDADYFAQKALTNCELVNAEDMLQNGTVVNGVAIDKPKRLITASTILTQIILAVTSSTYGGCTVTLTHLAPFVRDSFIGHLKDGFIWCEDMEEDEAEKMAAAFRNSGMTVLASEEYITAHKKVYNYALKKTLKEVRDSVQTFNYQVNSMTNTNGQAPFLTVFMYLGETDEFKPELAMLIEEFLHQRILGFKNRNGVYITPAFPKLIYVTEEDNIHEDSKYWYLTELSAKCIAKRMVPDLISEKIMKQLKIDENGNGNCYPAMGCRSFLTPYIDPKTGKPKYYGRFNGGVVTINLPDIALSARRDIYGETANDQPFELTPELEKKFWEIFEKRTEVCHKGLRKRYERIASITSDVAPILWQAGTFARLQPGESVEPLLRGGYATFSLGYAGLYECVKAMTGKSHSGGEGMEFGMKVMQALNDKCTQWREAEDIAYSLYGTPIESVTYKFAKSLQNKFGIIEGITDRGYITNSYHINVREEIDAFSKLSIESQYQKLSPGGAISYVEVPNMQNNIPAVLELIKFMYNNIMYAEINSKSDYCQCCGYDGEIQIKGEKAGNLYWECPNCGNKDQKLMNVARRTCGYIGTQFWNQGRTEEIKERVLHL